ncbi:protein transport protein Sec24C-like [Eurosta solidaginis]|uniref:protein transport protein Sec24C-like n=1 Tax=Eurosta solidaginis TaxID=178769 RepID=UPI0035310746
MARTVEGEYEPPIINFDARRRFQSLVCKVTTDVPTEYFQHLGHTGQRVDKYECPELVLVWTSILLIPVVRPQFQMMGQAV